jgi:hypothetical protein
MSWQLNRALLATLISALGGCATGRVPGPTEAATPAPARATLAVTQDESSLERSIGAFLEKNHYDVQYVEQNQDLVLLLGFEQGGAPFEMQIDTLPSANDGTERAIVISLHSHLKVEEEELAAVEKKINSHHNKFWAGCFYVDDKDGEIMGTWSINLPNVAVPADLVLDAVQRLGSSFSDLRAQLAETTAPSSLQTSL